MHRDCRSAITEPQAAMTAAAVPEIQPDRQSTPSRELADAPDEVVGRYSIFAHLCATSRSLSDRRASTGAGIIAA
jgi:hypothetical protein